MKKEYINDVTAPKVCSNCCGGTIYQLGDTYYCKACSEPCDPVSEE